MNDICTIAMPKSIFSMKYYEKKCGSNLFSTSYTVKLFHIFTWCIFKRMNKLKEG